jgi:hypothetical protein
MFESAIDFVYKVSHNIVHDDNDDGWSHICGGSGGAVF